MTTTKESVYLSCAQTAQKIRPLLKAAFPGVKFSVTSKTYSGGASIDVSWTDGPAGDLVNAIVKRFEGCSFDGMTDLKEYREATVVMQKDGSLVVEKYGANFIFTNRHLSAAVEQRMLKQVCEFWGIEVPKPDEVRTTRIHNQWLDQLVYRESVKRSFV